MNPVGVTFKEDAFGSPKHLSFSLYSKLFVLFLQLIYKKYQYDEKDFFIIYVVVFNIFEFFGLGL